MTMGYLFALKEGQSEPIYIQLLMATQNPLQQILIAEESLIHISNCRNFQCNFLKCRKIKRVIRHLSRCENLLRRQCRYCNQLIALCCFHAKRCRRPNCNTFLCSTIKDKLQGRLWTNEFIFKAGKSPMGILYKLSRLVSSK